MRRRLLIAAVAAGLFVAPLARAEMKASDRPLVIAIASSDVEAIRRAVSGGANVNFVDGNVTPLNLAVSMKQAAAVDALLALGADPNVKDAQGRSAIDIARINAAPEIEAKLQAAVKAKPAEAGAKPAAADAKPATPQPAATAPAGERGTFDDVEFTTPDAKTWTPKVVDNNLVFSAPLPPPDFCTITVYASRDLKGDDEAFKKAFDDAVQQSLKKLDTVKVEKDGGATKVESQKPGMTLMQRVILAEAKDFHTVHFFIAIHSQDRMQLIAYQSSGVEMFQHYQADATAFANSVSVVTSKPLNP